MPFPPQGISNDERKVTFVFIDGGYLRAIIRNLNNGEKVLSDAKRYAHLIEKILSKIDYHVFPIGRVVVTRILYYDAIVPAEEDPKEYQKQKEFFNRLQLNMSMCDIRLGDLIRSGEGRYKQKGSIP